MLLPLAHNRDEARAHIHISAAPYILTFADDKVVGVYTRNPNWQSSRSLDASRDARDEFSTFRHAQ